MPLVIKNGKKMHKVGGKLIPVKKHPKKTGKSRKKK